MPPFKPSTKRVVVTGMGVLSPLGNSLKESWDALKLGKSGLSEEGDLPCGAAGRLKGFESTLSAKDGRRLDPFVHYAYDAARMALEDAGLRKKDFLSSSVIVGSSRGGITSIEDALRGRPTAYLMPASTISMAASFIALKFGIKGRLLGISTACASGAHAIGEAFGAIRAGISDIALAGGSEAPICRLCVEGYSLSKALSRTGISRPFDRRRDGFVLSEGAAVLVLEEYDSALARGARPYGEIAGYGNTADAHHETVPDKSGQARAIKEAIKDAGIRPADVGYISAHATSTVIGDNSEAGAIRLAFGEGTKVPVGANKSATGHMLGASGAFEAAMALMGVKEGVIPPTVNLTEPEGGLNYITRLTGADLRVVLSNSFGFGGVNAALVFKRL